MSTADRRTTISVVVPPPDDEPSAYVNPGSGDPFAVLTFSPGLWLYIHDPAYLRTLAQVASQAAVQLEDAQRRASEQSSCPHSYCAGQS